MNSLATPTELHIACSCMCMYQHAHKVLSELFTAKNLYKFI